MVLPEWCENANGGSPPPVDQPKLDSVLKSKKAVGGGDGGMGDEGGIGDLGGAGGGAGEAGGGGGGSGITVKEAAMAPADMPMLLPTQFESIATAARSSCGLPDGVNSISQPWRESGELDGKVVGDAVAVEPSAAAPRAEERRVPSLAPVDEKLVSPRTFYSKPRRRKVNLREYGACRLVRRCGACQMIFEIQKVV
eukprot:7382701-Prymnesium_polylepis.2